MRLAAASEHGGGGGGGDAVDARTTRPTKLPSYKVVLQTYKVAKLQRYELQATRSSSSWKLQDASYKGTNL